MKSLNLRPGNRLEQIQIHNLSLNLLMVETFVYIWITDVLDYTNTCTLGCSGIPVLEYEN